MLQADGVTYEIETADGELKLLNNVSFQVPKGHFMAIVGPSGCGKTTLLKAIAGMIVETDGRFLWEGVDLAEEDFAPTEVGCVPQFSIAYDQLSVDENVESAARLRCRFSSAYDLDASIDNALKVSGMEAIADRDVKILSGGQKRRLALAMELVSNPRLLICDEVTSGLDPRSEHDIVNLLHDISNSDGRIVISVTHSLSHLDKYDSILVMHQGCLAYHGSPRTMLHYFGVSAVEEIYPKLQERSGASWARSWEKHREFYYAHMEKDLAEKAISENHETQPAEEAVNAETETELKETAVKQTAADEDEREEAWEETPDDSPELPDEEESPEDDEGAEYDEEEFTEVPGFFTQFFCLLGRRWRIFFRDRTQLVLQLVMILLFTIMVAMFTEQGTGQIVDLGVTQEAGSVLKDIADKQDNMKTGSAVSGIIMFEVILLGLMGSNNAAREVAGERLIMEKEKYAGMRPSAYLASKMVYLSVLVLIQSAWMFAFVDFFWGRGGGMTHLLFLMLANAAMTFVCLGISSMAKSADQASLMSIYLVGFQLPLSGAVLALPEYLEGVIRPFISAYWAWSGCLSALSSDVYQAVKNVVATSLTEPQTCYAVLGAHVLVGIIVAYAGIKKSRWDI